MIVYDVKNDHVYIDQFNSDWCPDDRKLWLCTVTMDQTMKNVASSRQNAKKECFDAYNKLMGTLNG